MSFYFKRIWILCIVMLFFTFNSCEIEPSPKSLGDSRFNGSFTGITGGGSTPALHLSNHSFLTCIFDGTNKVWMAVSRDSYGVEVYKHNGYAEWEISGNQYRYRGWGDDSSWSIWAEYNFLSDKELSIQWDPRYDSKSDLEWITLTNY